MYDVFISCKSEDYSKAKDVYYWLKDQGYSPFFADISLNGYYAPGKSAVFGKEVDKAIEEVDNMIVLASKAEYITSEYVEDEWRLFVEEQRAGRKSGNIITILDGVSVSDLPIKLRNVQSFSLNNYKNGLLGFLPKRVAVKDKVNNEREQEQKAREERDRLRSAHLNGQEEKNKTPQPPVPKRREWVKRYIWVIAILLLLVALAVMLIKGGKSTPEPVVPVDTLQHSLVKPSQDEQVITVLPEQESIAKVATQNVEPGQPSVNTKQGQEKPEKQSSSNVSVRQVNGDLFFTVNGVSFKMVEVEGGRYRHGARTRTAVWDAHKNSWDYGVKDTIYNLRYYESTVSDFYIGEVEVSNSLWNAVMGKACRGGEYCHAFDSYPVDSVSWDDAQSFIKIMNEKTGSRFRLPTFSEWQYAARGGQKSKGYIYSGSNAIGEVAWFRANHETGVHRSRRKKKNELGLYDMSGNVSEWCDGRVRAGGSWCDYAHECTVFSCSTIQSSSNYVGFGLRLAMDY